MINGLGCQATTGGAITLHFNYANSKNINKSNNSGLKSTTLPAMAATATKIEYNSSNNNNNINSNNNGSNNNSSNNNNSTTAVASGINSNTIGNANAKKVGDIETLSKIVKIKKYNVNTDNMTANYPQLQQQQSTIWVPMEHFVYTPDDILKPTTTKSPTPTAIKFITATNYANISENTKEKPFVKDSGLRSFTNADEGRQIPGIVSPSSTPGNAFIELRASATTSIVSGQQRQQRTEDQENAFRRIEDVHNYAKLQHYSYSNEGSTEEDATDGDDDELDNDLECAAVEQKNAIVVPKKRALLYSADDSEEHVDIVTVTQEQQDIEAAAICMQETAINADQDVRPEHHARRPMNAFLIFCKRHRAIVKERYKSLENRAITKILGDWWAALDKKEKQCFTDLAQQNKDAFFNANPNFKWYKLPAPPLRTLATRPSNAMASGGAHLANLEDQASHTVWQNPPLDSTVIPTNLTAAAVHGNYFKLADETQMGELSTLLSSKGNAAVQDKEYALQQALSETTQFLSAHIPGDNSKSNTKVSVCQKRLHLHDSASNSSEEDGHVAHKKPKSTRSCKGKIYQELINSGQIAAIAKKTKCKSEGTASNSSSMLFMEHQRQLMDSDNRSVRSATMSALASGQEHKQDRSISECSNNSNGNGSGSSMATDFDLEEKIKELPALCLDAYLQRKRSIKKKKKFSNTKKLRNSSSSSPGSEAGKKAPASSANLSSSSTAIGLRHEEAQKTARAKAAAAAAAAAVGSQKRKARKESITRRDVNAIEQEVASISILPLTINGSYYLSRTTPATLASGATNGGSTDGGSVGINSAGRASTEVPVQSTSVEHDVSPPLSSSSASSKLSGYEQRFDVTSTSDLLILAEVAANRTELTN